MLVVLVIITVLHKWTCVRSSSGCWSHCKQVLMIQNSLPPRQKHIFSFELAVPLYARVFLASPCNSTKSLLIFLFENLAPQPNIYVHYVQMFCYLLGQCLLLKHLSVLKHQF